MAKVDRLLNIVAALQASSVPLTAEEIRERVPGYESHSDDTFRRTFERDKDELRQAGVPVETVMVAHTEQPRAAYRIRRDRYELADPGLSPEELAALHLAATSVRLVGIPVDEVEDALRKLGGTGGEQQRHRSARSTHPTPWPWCSLPCSTTRSSRSAIPATSGTSSPTGCSTSRGSGT